MSQRSALRHLRNTPTVSPFWGMRLTIVYAVMDADYQNRINLQDKTLNLTVVARQPHPDPNYAPHAAAHLLAVA